ncbi:MAG: lipoyl synthase [Acidobacteria bacterium]|nr:lipoyl synthase [Acidobacteriota bacterium]
MGIGQLPILQPGPPPLRRPPWLKVRLPGGENYTDLKRLVRRLDLNTVCESARCPNLAECWQHRTATFMILGNTCTRACGFCAVPSGKPDPAMDWDEPRRVAEAAAHMELKYAVVTSVNRDDQPDGGAAIFAATIHAVRERLPECKIEVLIPDFRGDWAALATVLAARPDVLNHNTETVPRLYRQVRRGALYERSQELLRRAKQLNPRIPTKSGIMVGLGESYDEIIETLRDLRAQRVDILTVGQYLQPTAQHLPIARFYHPDEFAAIKRAALALGFKHAECGPLVRSSYHAHEQQEAAAASLV